MWESVKAKKSVPFMHCSIWVKLPHISAAQHVKGLMGLLAGIPSVGAKGCCKQGDCTRCYNGGAVGRVGPANVKKRPGCILCHCWLDGLRPEGGYYGRHCTLCYTGVLASGNTRNVTQRPASPLFHRWQTGMGPERGYNGGHCTL